MKCPTCEGADLRPAQLEHGLPCVGCAQCGGYQVSLVAYRHWSERFREPGKDADQHTTGIESDSKSALLCPKCERLMLKFKYTIERDGNLDLCSHCDEIWLDRGEWERLKHLNLVGDLPAVFTGPWQRALREARSAEAIARTWMTRLGDDFKTVSEFRDWLENHPRGVDILTYLNNARPDKSSSA